MSTLDALHGLTHRADEVGLSGANREGLALYLLDRIIRAEGGEPGQSARSYTLDLLREILLTIDGKRNPPITLPTVDRRAG